MEKSFNKRPSPLREMMVNMFFEALESEDVWKQGWKVAGTPSSYATNKPYKGANRLLLTLISIREGYVDNRWITANQIYKNHYTVKDEFLKNGKIDSKYAVPIEFYSYYDKKTKRDYDVSTIENLSEEERKAYLKENVFAIRKYHYLYNVDLVEGKNLEHRKRLINSDNKNPRAEKAIEIWDQNECRIYHNSDESYYEPNEDTIHIPEYSSFVSPSEYYTTIFHEISHATGHESRLNRQIRNKANGYNYAVEELRAEISSLFILQDMEVPLTKECLKNSSSYISSWAKSLSKDKNEITEAILRATNDSEKIVGYLNEHLNMDELRNIPTNSIEEKQIEEEKSVDVTNNNSIENIIGKNIDTNYIYPFALIKTGEKTYDVNILAPNGEIGVPKDYSDLTKFQVHKKLSQYGQENFVKFKEVSVDELKDISIESFKRGTLEKFTPDLIKKPSEVIHDNKINELKNKMKNKGISTLTYMDDINLVNSLINKTEQGAAFEILYNGGSIYKEKDQNERSLIMRITAKAIGNPEQILRIFASSGLYEKERQNDYINWINEASQVINHMNEVREKSNERNLGKDYTKNKIKEKENVK